MAIQISGTTVIDNSRNLSNIANASTSSSANAYVVRDGSGNFSAGTISAALNGNASTASTLQTARNINGISFNGSANIETNPFSTGGTAYSNGYGGRYVSTNSPTGGNNGDIWYKV